MQNQEKFIKKENLYESVVKHIQSQIINGDLRPGDRLPAQDVFSKQLGISRVTLREALKALSSLGLISIQQGGGTYINNVTPDLFMQPMLPVLALGGNFQEIIEARIYVELGTVQLCSRNRDDDVLKNLEESLNKMEQSLQEKDITLFTTSDLEFHLAIGHGSGNSILARILEIIQDILFQQQKKINIYSQIRKDSYEFHKLIYGKIKESDSKGAEKAMLDHLNRVQDFALEKKIGNVSVDKKHNA